jgi:hypothetical protein
VLASEQLLRAKDVRITRIERQGRITVAVPSGENLSLDPDPLHPILLDPLLTLSHSGTERG